MLYHENSAFGVSPAAWCEVGVSKFGGYAAGIGHILDDGTAVIANCIAGVVRRCLCLCLIFFLQHICSMLLCHEF